MLEFIAFALFLIEVQMLGVVILLVIVELLGMLVKNIRK